MMAKILARMAEQNTAIVGMACVGLLIFLGVFVGLLWWTSRRENRQIYQKVSKMPLEVDV